MNREDISVAFKKIGASNEKEKKNLTTIIKVTSGMPFQVEKLVGVTL